MLTGLKARFCLFIFGVLTLNGLNAIAGEQGQPHPSPAPSFGLYPSSHFVMLKDGCNDCEALPSVRYYFRDEVIAVPDRKQLRAGFTRHLSIQADLAAWATETPVGSEIAYPPLLWVGASEKYSSANLSADGQNIHIGDESRPIQLVPKLPMNGAWFNSNSLAYFHGQPLKMRGFQHDDAFVVRTIWPEDFRLPSQPAAINLTPEAVSLRDWVRAEPQGGANRPFSVNSAWRRSTASAPSPGQPMIGLMLNGAQGDDDEAHGGHFALMTGRVGPRGAMDDWLVYNFYTLDSVSEKGIIAAPVPLDNYLADLNSGQAWYRPSYMLVATLKNPRTALHLQSALARVFNQFYRHQFVYQHARANCAGTSVMTLRALGWKVPERGPESWIKAVFALPLVAIQEGSLSKGKAVFDYLTEDRTKLYPAAAFEELGADLLRLASARTDRPLSEFERLLAEDIEEILLVRMPQFPSSRAWGDYPIESSVEYLARVPTDPAQQKIIPVPPRHFPAELRDPEAPTEPPLRSDYAVAAWALAIVLLIVVTVRRLLA